jgi:hypothetical protein
MSLASLHFPCGMNGPHRGRACLPGGSHCCRTTLQAAGLGLMATAVSLTLLINSQLDADGAYGVPARLPACLPARLPACLPARLPACPPACLPVLLGMRGCLQGPLQPSPSCCYVMLCCHLSALPACPSPGARSACCRPRLRPQAVPGDPHRHPVQLQGKGPVRPDQRRRGGRGRGGGAGAV